MPCGDLSLALKLLDRAVYSTGVLGGLALGKLAYDLYSVGVGVNSALQCDGVGVNGIHLDE